MAYHIAHSDYSYGFRTLEAIRSIKDGARWDMSICDPSLGDIPDWNENPEAYAALERVQETARELEKRGFDMTESYANFLFVKHPVLDGGKLYEKLKEMGILVRHFTAPRISDYNRITVGTRAEMDALIAAIDQIIKEELS